jgi:hypothetical protein
MLAMPTGNRPPLTPFAARVVRRLLDSSLTWREITEAFSLPTGAGRQVQQAPAAPACWRVRPDPIRRAPRNGRPGPTQH